MDLVVNHTSKDSELVASNPHWFTRDARGNVVSPYATDPADPTQKTVWGDLAELDYRPPQQRQILGYFQAAGASLHRPGVWRVPLRCRL